MPISGTYLVKMAQKRHSCFDRVQELPVRSLYFKMFSILFLGSSVILRGQSITHERRMVELMDSAIEYKVALHKIPGLAIGIVCNDSILFEGYYGKSGKGHPIDKNTVFKTYGITKLVVTTAIFRLIDEGKLNLEDRLSTYLQDIPNSWQNIQVKHIITHSTGIHNTIGFGVGDTNSTYFKKLGKLPLTSDPGEKFDFNSINYWLLGELIETISGESLEVYVQKNILGGKGSNQWFTTYLSPNAANVDYFEGYNPWENGYLNTVDRLYDRDQASDGLNCTLGLLMNWIKRTQTNTLFSRRTKHQMISQATYGNDDASFAYGWSVFHGDEENSYGLTSSRTSLRMFPDHGLTIIVLSTGYGYYPIQNELIDTIAGMVFPELIDHKRLSFYEISDSLVQRRASNANAILEQVKEVVQENELERFLNFLGESSLVLQNPNAALVFFKANVKHFPNSVSVYERLAIFYRNQGLHKEAASVLKQLFEIDPNHSWKR